MIEHALMSLLVADSTVTGLVGERIYYVKAPQAVEVPYIVFLKVSGPREHSHQGAAGLANPRFQFSIFSTTYYEAKQIAQAIQGALQGYQGTSETVYIYSILYENETDFYEDDAGLYHVAVDYMVQHKE